MQQVNSWSELVSLVQQGNTDFFIRVGGVCRSSKSIDIASDDGDELTLSVVHEIDDTEDLVTEQNFGELTNIADAMQTGNFFCYA